MADRLSRAFQALADPTRRDLVARLAADGDASVGDLAAPYDVSVQAVSKHLKVLEDAGLVSRSRDAQRRPVHLEAEVLRPDDRRGSSATGSTAEERYARLDAGARGGRMRSVGCHDDGEEPDPDRGGPRPAGDPDRPRVRRSAGAGLPRAGPIPSCSSGGSARAASTPGSTCGTPGPVASGATPSSREADDFSMGFWGSFHEVREPERLVQTFSFDGAPDGVSLETMTFEALEGGRCRAVATSVVETIEIRDRILSSGMDVRRGRGLREARRAAAEPVVSAADDHRSVAGDFTRRVVGVRDWDAPAPVDGWVARDVVRHLVEWLPALLEGGAGVTLAAGPSVDVDPVGAWQVHCAAVQDAARRPRDPVEGAEQPAHRRGAARRGGRPLLHVRRLHAHLGSRARDGSGRDARPRAVRGDARRHGADGRDAAGERAVRPAGRGARRRRRSDPADRLHRAGPLESA